MSWHCGRRRTKSTFVCRINVRPIDASKVEWFTADHETPGSDDLCFLTASTPNEVVVHLKACGVAIEQGPVKRAGARGNGQFQEVTWDEALSELISRLDALTEANDQKSLAFFDSASKRIARSAHRRVCGAIRCSLTNII